MSVFYASDITYSKQLAVAEILTGENLRTDIMAKANIFLFMQ